MTKIFRTTLPSLQTYVYWKFSLGIYALLPEFWNMGIPTFLSYVLKAK